MGRVSMLQGKGNQLYNRREFEETNRPIFDDIDVLKSSENITLVDKNIRSAYSEIFGEALEKYNRKQKRADRKIESYYDHVQKSKNGEQLFYECVVQWGRKDDFKEPVPVRPRGFPSPSRELPFSVRLRVPRMARAMR